MSTPTTKHDAANRSARTILQGLGIDLAVAVAVALLAWLPDADLSSRAAWIIFGTALAKTVLMAAASYIMRLKVAPSEPLS